MHHAHPLANFRVVHAHVIGVVHHQRCRAVGHGGLEGFERRVTVLFDHQGDDLEPGGGGRRGAAGVSLDRGDDLVTLLQFATGSVVGTGHRATGVRRVSTAACLEDELIHPGQFTQDRVHAMHDFERTLQGVLVLIRMHVSNFRAPGHRLVDLRVVLHGAGAEQADIHHAQRLLRQAQVVIQHLGLGHLRQRRFAGASHVRGDQTVGAADRRLHVRLNVGKDHTATAGIAHLQNDGFAPDGSMVLLEWCAHCAITFLSAAVRR
ncbi:hypothetical protein D9M69_427120 [compost metagenome]